jgi:hypothetical protein
MNRNQLAPGHHRVLYALNAAGSGRVGPVWSPARSQRPAAGGTLMAWSRPSLMPIARTSSGSPTSVTVPLWSRPTRPSIEMSGSARRR